MEVFKLIAVFHGKIDIQWYEESARNYTKLYFFYFLFFASIDPYCLYRYGASILAGKEEETDSLKIKLMHFYSPLWRLFCLDVGRNKGNRNVLLLPR